MAVTVAGFVESLRTGTTDPHTWSHDQGTTAPKGVIVMAMHGVSSTDHVVGVSYGTATLTRIKRNVDTSGEPGAAEIWFVGAGVPTGTQTVSADLTSATTDDIHFVSITLDGGGDLTIVDSDGIDENAANPSVTLQYLGRSAMAFAALYSGVTAITSITAGTDCTLFTTSELSGNFCSVGLRQTTAGTADFAIAATVGTDDVAYAAVAVTERVPVTLAITVTTTTITPLEPGLRAAHKLPVEVTTTAVTTQDVTLTKYSPPKAITADVTTYTVTGIDVGPYVLTIQITPVAVTLTKGYGLAAEATACTVTTTQAVGLTATHRQGIEVTTASLTPQDVGLRAARRGDTTTALALTVGTPDVGLRRALRFALEVTAYTVTGQSIFPVLYASPASLAVTSQEVGLSHGVPGKIVAEATAYTVTGPDVGLRATRTPLGITADALTVASQAVGLLAARQLVATPLAVALTGQPVTTRAAHRLVATSGGVTVTSQAVTLTAPPARLLIDPAAFTVTGQDVILLSPSSAPAYWGRRYWPAHYWTIRYWTGGPPQAFSLTAAPAAFAVTGRSVQLLSPKVIPYWTLHYWPAHFWAGRYWPRPPQAEHVISVEATAYHVIGQAVGVPRTYLRLVAQSAAYTVTGQAVTLPQRRMHCETAAYVVTTYQGVNFRKYHLNATPASVAVTPQETTLKVYPYRLAATTATLSVTPEHVLLRYSPNPPTPPWEIPEPGGHGRVLVLRRPRRRH